MARRRPRRMITDFSVTANTVLIDLAVPRTILSSAPRGGGLVRARYILNHQVPANPAASEPSRPWEDPARYLGRLAARMGVGPCVALMTAVPMERLVLAREQYGDVWIEGFLTVGVSNAVRAGEPIDPSGMRPRLPCGTINIILVTNARLSASAMVGAVQVATESKTAALLSRRVPSQSGRSAATGTGTDALIVARGDGPSVRYSGTHTKFGEMVGRLVERGVIEGLLFSSR